MLKHSEISSQVIEAFYHVYNTLGQGFLERVYQNALAIELQNRGLLVQVQAPIEVYYGGIVVGEYFADLLIDERLIVEIKAVDMLCDKHHAQLLNYLKATNIEVGLLLNFGPKPEVCQKVFETARHHSTDPRQSAQRSLV